MKRFASAFLAVLIVVETFLFFGGYALFDFARHYYLAGAVWALIIAGVCHAFIIQHERILALEQRLRKLEVQKD